MNKSVVLAIDLLILFPTVIGNTLVLLSLAFFRRLRKKPCYLLVGNLALADLLVGILILPMDLVILSSDSVSRDSAVCRWFHCLSYTITGASVQAMLIMSVERFHAVYFPFVHEQRFSIRRVYIAVLLSWLLMLVIGQLPHVIQLVLPTTQMNESGSFIYMHCRSKSALHIVYVKVFNILFGIMLVTSFGLFLVVVRMSVKILNHDRISENHGPTEHVVKMKIHFRYTIMMLILSGMFVVCWAPHCVVSVLYPRDPGYHHVRCWLTTLGLINSGLDWIVYGVMKRKFRAAFTSILTCSVSSSRRYELPDNTI